MNLYRAASVHFYPTQTDTLRLGCQLSNTERDNFGFAPHRSFSLSQPLHFRFDHQLCHVPPIKLSSAARDILRKVPWAAAVMYRPKAFRKSKAEVWGLGFALHANERPRRSSLVAVGNWGHVTDD